MKAITLWPPWGWAFCHGKLVENRDWPAPFKHGEPVAIHQGVGTQDLEGLWDEYGWQWPVGRQPPPPPSSFQRLRDTKGRVVQSPEAFVEAGNDPAAALGCVVAVATFDRNTTGRLPATSGQADFRDGARYGWLFSKSEPLSIPVLAVGAQKVWTMPADVEERVLELWYRRLM